jgi:hypothetical protein
MNDDESMPHMVYISEWATRAYEAGEIRMNQDEYFEFLDHVKALREIWARTPGTADREVEDSILTMLEEKISTATIS